MSVKKSDLVDNIWSFCEGKISRQAASTLLEVTIDEIKRGFARGEKLMISSFGVFSVLDKKERVGRNPRTGEPITITGRRVVSFKPSVVLKSSMNPQKQ